jgi:hypothetical protein
MSNTANTCMSVNCQYILPQHNLNDFEKQLDSCLTTLILLVEQGKELIHSVTIFVSATTNNSFRAYHEYAHRALTAQLKPLPPFIIVAQPPMQPNLVAFEVITIQPEVTNTYNYSDFRGLPYLTIEGQGFKELISSGISHPDLMAGIDNQSQGCFEFTQQLLAHEGMTFGDVVRQWNYIEGIVDCVGQSQHYQVFNDVRSVYYNKCRFNHGYPAATGIGTFAGGVTLAVVARQCIDEQCLMPIKNPNQMDAHQYSERVLRDNQIYLLEQKSTPKFERGKLVNCGDDAILYVSGTASIKGEDTVDEGNLVGQTHTTLDNIEELIAVNNLGKQSPTYSYNSSSILNLRVYVKEPSDLLLAYQTCSKRYPNVPIQAVCAHVCRPCLLVEIECMVRVY